MVKHSEIKLSDMNSVLFFSLKRKTYQKTTPLEQMKKEQNKDR